MKKILTVMMVVAILALSGFAVAHADEQAATPAVIQSMPQSTAPVMATPLTNEVRTLSFTPGGGGGFVYLCRQATLGTEAHLVIGSYKDFAELWAQYIHPQKKESVAANQDIKDMVGLAAALKIKPLLGKIPDFQWVADTLNPALTAGLAVPTDFNFRKWDVTIGVALINKTFTNIPLIE